MYSVFPQGYVHLFKIKNMNENKISFCLKTLCEYEEGWHVNIQSPLLIENVEFSYYPYLARIMNILKYGNLSTELKIFLTKNNILNSLIFTEERAPVTITIILRKITVTCLK